MDYDEGDWLLACASRGEAHCLLTAHDILSLGQRRCNDKYHLSGCARNLREAVR